VFLGYVGKVLMTGQNLTFLEFLPKFFTSTDYFTWSQLWFLAYLFTFTILYMPLFLWLKRVKVGSADALLPQPFVAGRVWLYAPLGPLLLIQLALRARWPGLQNLYDDWANFAYYSSFFIMGFLLGRQSEIEDAIGREWKRAGKVGLALSVVFLLTWSQRQWNDGVRYFLYYTLGTTMGYCLLLGMLGFARAHLCFGNRAQKYLSESALPVYLLHQGCIVFPGYAIIQFAWGIPAKLSLLLPLSFLLTMSAYHFLVRPFNTLRFLFGMKRRASPPLAPALRNP
jgi:surface polysaccharide O-acyltransferase-like enzyme